MTRTSEVAVSDITSDSCTELTLLFPAAAHSIAYKQKQKEEQAALKKAQEAAKKGGPLVTGGSKFDESLVWNLAYKGVSSQLLNDLTSQKVRQEVAACPSLPYCQFPNQSRSYPVSMPLSTTFRLLTHVPILHKRQFMFASRVVQNPVPKPRTQHTL